MYVTNTAGRSYYFTFDHLEGHEPEPEKPPPPDIPWECHNTRPVDPEKAWAAVQAMCGGN